MMAADILSAAADAACRCPRDPETRTPPERHAEGCAGGEAHALLDRLVRAERERGEIEKANYALRHLCWACVQYDCDCKGSLVMGCSRCDAHPSDPFQAAAEKAEAALDVAQAKLLLVEGERDAARKALALKDLPDFTEREAIRSELIRQGFRDADRAEAADHMARRVGEAGLAAVTDGQPGLKRALAEYLKWRDGAPPGECDHSACAGPLTGTRCGAEGCGLPQFETPHGVVCDAGHGGASPASEAPSCEWRAQGSECPCGQTPTRHPMNGGGWYCEEHAARIESCAPPRGGARG